MNNPVVRVKNQQYRSINELSMQLFSPEFYKYC